MLAKGETQNTDRKNWKGKGKSSGKWKQMVEIGGFYGEIVAGDCHCSVCEGFRRQNGGWISDKGI